MQSKRRRRIPARAVAERQAADLLELFYQVHYRGNMAVEEAMRGGLTHKQAAILWLIRSAGGENGRMRRKDVVLRLQDWFEVRGPAITQPLAVSRASRKLTYDRLADWPSH